MLLRRMDIYLLFEEGYQATVPRHPQQVDVLPLGEPRFRWGEATGEAGRRLHVTPHVYGGKRVQVP